MEANHTNSNSKNSSKKSKNQAIITGYQASPLRPLPNYVLIISILIDKSIAQCYDIYTTRQHHKPSHKYLVYLASQIKPFIISLTNYVSQIFTLLKQPINDYPTMCPIKNNLNVLYLEHNKSLKHKILPPSQMMTEVSVLDLLSKIVDAKFQSYNIKLNSNSM